MPEKPATYIMEVTAEAATSIKKDKTSEAVIKQMTETRTEKTAEAVMSEKEKNPQTCNAIQGRERVKQERAQGGCLGTESRRKT